MNDRKSSPEEYRKPVTRVLVARALLVLGAMVLILVVAISPSARADTANIVVNPHCDGTMNVDATFDFEPAESSSMLVEVTGQADRTFIDSDGDLRGFHVVVTGVPTVTYSWTVTITYQGGVIGTASGTQVCSTPTPTPTLTVTPTPTPTTPTSTPTPTPTVTPTPTPTTPTSTPTPTPTETPTPTPTTPTSTPTNTPTAPPPADNGGGPPASLPQTGGEAKVAVALFGAVMVAAGGLLLLRRRA